ncbi:hypothetical protein HIM_10641 [Hirsutella minnesotensis 3608]|uniref:Uncharacterized protein n=1 Tax=Hirsutella minnesotensis 3608 TaxID=1043627 RepID=A0A0F7ZJU5_9HYPO|nr:hypothetical protein HIM_10641 [Hirsutella minnesotensis 3608]
MSYLRTSSSSSRLSPEVSTPCPTPLFPTAFSRLSQPTTVAKQLEEAALQDLPVNPTIEDLPKIVWKNRRFVQEASLARKGAKARISQSVMSGAAVVAIRRVGRNSSRYKPHLQQQIIFASTYPALD